MEHYDLNTARVSGKIIRLWSRQADVFARLVLPGEQQTYLVLRFQNGMVGGSPLTLQCGDQIIANGFLHGYEYQETIHNFLKAAEASSFLETVPEEDRAAWSAITFPRINTILDVVDISPASNGEAVNQATVEGIVARAWAYGGDTFARLAVYDAHTATTGQPGNRGYPRRIPHYVSVLFPRGRLDGREAQPRVKERWRVSGAVVGRLYTRTLHEALLRLGSTKIVELVQRLPDESRLHEIARKQESVHLLASAGIRFS